MALATIRPKTAGANFTIAGVEYNNVFNYAEVSSDAPLLIETVFSTEGAGGESSIGTEILTIIFRGLMKRGASNAGPLIPLPQNVAIVCEWDDGCSISCSGNFDHAMGGRAAGGIGVIDGRASSTGAFTKSWNASS